MHNPVHIDQNFVDEFSDEYGVKDEVIPDVDDEFDVSKTVDIAAVYFIRYFKYKDLDKKFHVDT